MEPHRIYLQVREVTSVSVAFTLRTVPTRHGVVPVPADDEETFRAPTISEALGRGLAVKVNSNNWKRVVVQVDDDEQEAIVIVYGLLPRKRYDICLNVAASDETISESITTAHAGASFSTPYDVDATNTPNGPDVAGSAATLTPPATPIQIQASPPKAVPVEDHITQLQKQLTTINEKRDELISQLKTTRRESQRMETNLKSEIEMLRRASEKHASSEHRNRQKVLALQEAVKQTNAAADDFEDLAQSVEETLPALGARAKVAQHLYEQVKYEVEDACSGLDDVIKGNNQVVQELQTELTNLCGKLEKVASKKEKLEKDSIPRLEEKLVEIRKEVGDIQAPSNVESHKDGREDAAGIWSVRSWMPPIQRPAFRQHGHQ